MFCQLFLLFQWLYYFSFCFSSSFRFLYGSSGQMAEEGRAPAFAEVGALAGASCATGGEGVQEETGENRKPDQ